MVQAKTRISYIIPASTETAPRLELPLHGVSRLGATGPLLIPHSGSSNAVVPTEAAVWHKHPRHRLGIASLALDTSTQLVGRNTPEGILYSGGRDGLVMSWDLGVPMKKRKTAHHKDSYGGSGSGSSSRRQGRWEMLTGWGDDSIEEEAYDGDERPMSDGDVLGDVTTSLSKRRRAASVAGEIPHERQWDTDLSAFETGTPTNFRQCAQAHTDWVNDILLCNYNQTVVSASSDGTVKAWSPHFALPTEPSTIGSHSDYVRCLTYCRDQNWIGSGSFDRTIKLWDMSRTGALPLVTLSPADASAPKSSVYALAADPFGRTIASGSPERVVRLWDPRTGKRTGKLVGHTDNIRAILISEDSKYLLTGSADASVKLWSLVSQRCLHTFTHHTDSVWSLYSDHPSLEVFYSGDRSGLVCRVDIEDCADISDGECVVLCHDSSDPPASSEGINKIVVMDDNLLWTASGTSTIKRWNIPQKRSARPTPPVLLDADGERIPQASSPTTFKRRPPLYEVASEASTRPSTGQGYSSLTRLSSAPSVQSLASEQWRDKETETKLNGLPYESLVKLVSPNDPYTPFNTTKARDPEVATLYSAASIMSVPRQSTSTARPPAQAIFQQQSSTSMTSPLYSSRTDETIMMNSARADYEDRELAADAVPLCSEPDFVIAGDHGLVRSVILNDRIHALTVDTAGEVAVWDIVRGTCMGRYLPEDVANASQSHAGSVDSRGSGSRGAEKERSPREALEAVRELIEGEAVVSTWCMADTKAGVLTIHMTERCFEAEVYADEVGFVGDRHFNDESKLNIGKWVLRNLFIGFTREEIRRHHTQVDESKYSPTLSRHPSRDTLDYHTSRNGYSSSSSASSSPESRRKELKRSPNSGTVIYSPNMLQAVIPAVSSIIRSSPLLTPLIPLHPQMQLGLGNLPSIPQSPGIDGTPTPGPGHARTRSGTIDGAFPAASLMTPGPLTGAKEDYFSTSRMRQQSLQGGGGAVGPGGGPVVPGTPDDFSGWGGPAGATATTAIVPPITTALNTNVSATHTTASKAEPPTPNTPGGGLIGRLKNFAKTKRPVSDVLSSTTPATPSAENAPSSAHLPSSHVQISKTPLQQLLSGPLTPPTSLEAPLHNFPLQTTVLISVSADASSPSWVNVYRGQVVGTGGTADVEALEGTMPMWLVEYLLLGRVPGGANGGGQVGKVSFVLMPWTKDPEGEVLPELLNTTQSKLTASRYLRIRKIVNHVQDKLDRLSQSSNSRAASIRSSVDGGGQLTPQVHGGTRPSTPRRPGTPQSASLVRPGSAGVGIGAGGISQLPRAEDLYEILCNDTLLPLGMSLGAVRQYVWKQSAELVMYYRRKKR